jgi:hypothetical protein
MVKRTIVAVCIALSVLACQQRESKTSKATSSAPADLRNAKVDTIIHPDPPVFLDSSALGDQLGYDKNVLMDKNTIVEGHPIYLTLRLHESPKGLWTRALWKDESGNPIAAEDHDMKGEHVVTFKCDKPLKRGKYTVVGYWGGNIAVERPFEVVKAK